MGVVGVTLMLIGIAAGPADGATTVPALWTAGGLSAGNDSAGQAARMATDAWGNVAVVSGPSGGSDLAVTSYTADGIFRWRSTVTPASFTFVGDWVAAAPNGDFVAVGHNVDSHGRPIQSTMVRYTNDGALLWRVDLSVGFFPAVGRLVVDGAGNAYLALSAVGNGSFVQKYSPSGALLWSQQDTIGGGYAIAASLALSPDETDVAVTGSISGGATWATAVYSAATGVRRWQAAAAEGTAARDIVVDATRVYVTGQGVTGASTPALAYHLTVVAYDRATGARLWRRDKKPADGYDGAGLWMAKAPDGSIVVAGQTNRGFLDWYTVAFETTGAVRWEAVRDGGLNTDEVPRGVLVMEDGTTVVTGPGGPNLPGGYIQGVTAGYGPTGALLWEAFARMATVWVTALPNGEDVCATGGYDALVTCWRVSGVVNADMTINPSTGAAPLSVTFDGSGSTTPSGVVTSWAWSFGDGSFGTGPLTNHVYSTPGTYTASLTVTDSNGASSSATGTIVVNPLPPAAPSGLTASLSGSLVVLTWQDNSSNETVFSIERCEGTGCTNFASFASQWPDYPSYSDYSALSGRTYRYRVRAYNNGGYSPYSNIASILAGAGSVPTLSINDRSITEGNSGTKLATFVVTLSAASASQVRATYATANGTAAAPSDYAAVIGSVTFPAGSTSQTLSVTVNGDTIVEPNETFVVSLSDPSGATILDAQGAGAIINDDTAALPKLSISDASVTEGNSGTKTATFIATLSATASGTVTVGYSTANGTATAGSDYVAKSGTLTFTAGQTTKTIAVVVGGDTTVEPNETFTVNLASPTGATILDAQGVGTIVNNDGAALRTLSIGDVSVTEGNFGPKTATFIATLSAAASGTVTVGYSTANGTANAGSDYFAKSGTLTFTAGQTTKTLAVVVRGDTTVEPNETFSVKLTGAVGATLADAQGVATITNDDQPRARNR